jgi:hypothetical protein
MKLFDDIPYIEDHELKSLIDSEYSGFTAEEDKIELVYKSSYNNNKFMSLINN